MPKRIMGKDIAAISKEEMDAIMADLRSRRAGTNGRQGKKNPNHRCLEPNDFPLPKDQIKPGMFGKKRNEHIKAIFVTDREIYASSKCKTPIYIFGFLTDSNKFAFEEYHDFGKSINIKYPPDPGAYRLKRFQKMFAKKNIDEETFVIVNKDYVPKSTFVHRQIILMAKFNGAKLKQIGNADIIRKLIREYGIFKSRSVFRNCLKYSRKQINKVYSDIYDFVAENGLCPWISEESRDHLNTLFKYKRRSYMLAELGLFYAVLRKFDAVLIRKQGRFGGRNLS